MVQDNRYHTVLLFGAPGAGKGTQGGILGRIPGFFHISSGDVFRAIDVHSEVGRIFYEHSSRGELVPDDITIQLWKRNIHAREVLSYYKPQDDLLILDGIPRNLNQAQLMDDHINVLRIVHLICRDQEAMVRRLRKRALKQNRADDAREEVIRRRMEVYEQETMAVLRHYPKEIVEEVDADGSPGAVLRRVLKVLVPVQEAHFKNALD